MAYDEGLAQRVREEMSEMPGNVEKKMFGGIGFMLHDNMAGGVIESDLIVRVGSENYEESMAAPHTAPFDLTGRPMTGWVVVKPNGYQTDQDLAAWIEKGIEFSLTLPVETEHFLVWKEVALKSFAKRGHGYEFGA